MPQKMLRPDTGRALITHTLDVAEEARRLSEGEVVEVVVATDSQEILEVVNAYAVEQGIDARAEMTSPNHRSGTDRIAEVAARLPESITTIINIQGDEPEFPAADITRVGALLNEHPEAAMSTLAREIQDHATFINPNAVKVVMDRNGYCLYFSRSPIPCDRDDIRTEGDPYGYLHFGIYGYRREVLLGYGNLPVSALEELEKLEQLRALDAGLRIVAAVSHYDGTGIDTEEDYAAFVQRLSQR
jgi:3-deoxy-manno-octulosonate cytidylyltransferase (CMP-KDO synthetase)